VWAFLLAILNLPKQSPDYITGGLLLQGQVSLTRLVLGRVRFELPPEVARWSGPHQTGHPTGLAEWAAMNSRGDCICKPLWAWTEL
jgi:uncharacterized membrane protein